MALPQGDDPVSPRPQRPPGKVRQADWLVGAEEGLEAEIEGGGRALPRPQLRRPDEASPDDPEAQAARPPVRPVLTRPDAGSPLPAPAPARLPDLDDARLGAAAWLPRLEVTRELVVSPQLAPEPPPAREPAEPAAPRRRVPGEVALELLARYWMWPAGAAAVALAAVALAHAIGVGTTPLRSILRDPARYDGAAVRVRGRIGQDVFPVGAGHTFYLFQGRDSLVVFTRQIVPRARQKLELEAQVSTGMIGGETRPALLERVK